MRVQGARPTYDVRGLPQVSGGPTANADMFGAGNARQIGQFGAALQGFGEEVIHQDQVRRQKDDEVFERNATNNAQQQLADQTKALYDQYKGQDAVKIPEKMKELTKGIRDRVGAGLQNQHQRDAFARSMDAMEHQAQIEAMGYRDGQMEDARRQSLDGQNGLIKQKAVRNVANALTPDGRVVNQGRLDMVVENTRLRYRGAPAEFIELEIQKAKQTFHESLINAMERPEDAIQYLEFDDVKEALGPELTKALKKKQGKAMIADAKKDSENQMRQMGIRLGELYDSEIEIERALYDIEDRELADIARTEAMRIKKARSLSGEEARKDDKARANREEATRIAGAASNELEAQGMVDALEGVSEADREEIQKQAFARLKIKSAATETERKEAQGKLEEQEAESARINAEAIGKASRDEADILDTVNAMDNVTEAYRKKVNDMALTQFKAKQTRQTREKADATAQAMKAMEEQGWSLAAISPDWDQETQDKMREMAEKRQIIAADPERQLKALDYCDMSREELQRRVREGEWPQMTIELGGEGTPEYKMVWDKAFKESNAGHPGGSLKELQTPLQYAKTRYEAVTGLSASTQRGKKSYSEFLTLYEDGLREKALERGLDDVAKVSREDQDQIISKLLEKGRYVDGVLTWAKALGKDVLSYAPFFGYVSGDDTYRFEVQANPRQSEYNFTPAQRPNNNAESLIPAERLPEFAQPYAGMRDSERRVLPNGNVKIVNQNGDVVIVPPSGQPRLYPKIAEVQAGDGSTYQDRIGRIGQSINTAL